MAFDALGLVLERGPRGAPVSMRGASALPKRGVIGATSNSHPSEQRGQTAVSNLVADLMKEYTRRELAKATAAVERAKRQLRQAEHRFETDCGPEDAPQLIAEIKKAEKRLALAHARLRDLTA